MTTTLKNAASRREQTKQPTPKARGEIAKLVAERRRLTDRMEVLAGLLGDVASPSQRVPHIPERGRVQVIARIPDAVEVLNKEGVALAGGLDSKGNWTYTVLIDTLKLAEVREADDLCGAEDARAHAG